MIQLHWIASRQSESLDWILHSRHQIFQKSGIFYKSICDILVLYMEDINWYLQHQLEDEKLQMFGGGTKDVLANMNEVLVYIRNWYNHFWPENLRLTTIRWNCMSDMDWKSKKKSSSPEVQAVFLVELNDPIFSSMLTCDSSRRRLWRSLKKETVRHWGARGIMRQLKLCSIECNWPRRLMFHLLCNFENFDEKLSVVWSLTRNVPCIEPTIVSSCALDIAKHHTFQFQYNFMNQHFNCHVLYSVTDLLLYEIKNSDFHTELAKNRSLVLFLKFSVTPKIKNFTEQKIKWLHSINFVDGSVDVQFNEFIGIESIMYWNLTSDKHNQAAVNVG